MTFFPDFTKLCCSSVVEYFTCHQRTDLAGSKRDVLSIGWFRSTVQDVVRRGKSKIFSAFTRVADDSTLSSPLAARPYQRIGDAPHQLASNLDLQRGSLPTTPCSWWETWPLRRLSYIWKRLATWNHLKTFEDIWKTRMIQLDR